MPPFVDELRRWYDSYEKAGGRRQVVVCFSESPSDGRPKQSAWVDAEGVHAAGNLIVWESGECETHAVSTPHDHPILLRSRVLDDPARVAAVADDFVDHIADYSGM